MKTLERRLLPRTTPEKLVYIGIQRHNGGIVLNVSRDGLCFQSAVPVQRDQPFVICLSEQDRQSRASGKLAWIDETQKFGGLRFSSLSPDARRTINELLNVSSSIQCEAPSLSPFLLQEEEDDIVPAEPLEHEKPLTGLSSLRACHLVGAAQVDKTPVPGSSSQVTAMRPAERVCEPPGKFSATVVVVLFFSAVVASSFIEHRIRRGKPGVEFLAASEQAGVEHPDVMGQTAVSPPHDVAPTVSIAKQTFALPLAPLPRGGASAPRAGKHGTREVVERPVPAAMQQTAERVVIHKAPQSFRYPVAPNSTQSGKVSLRLLLGTDGSVRKVSVLRGNRLLADAAVKAVRQWRYSPMELHGQAVEIEANITIYFAGDDAVSINFLR